MRGLQDIIKRHAMRQILAVCGGARGAPFLWLDAEGASLIGTLRKAWLGTPPPPLLATFISRLLERGIVLGAEDAAAVQSCALGVAHLLPVVLHCASHPAAAESVALDELQRLPTMKTCVRHPMHIQTDYSSAIRLCPLRVHNCQF